MLARGTPRSEFQRNRRIIVWFIVSILTGSPQKQNNHCLSCSNTPTRQEKGKTVKKGKMPSSAPTRRALVSHLTLSLPVLPLTGSARAPPKSSNPQQATKTHTSHPGSSNPPVPIIRFCLVYRRTAGAPLCFPRHAPKTSCPPFAEVSQPELNAASRPLSHTLSRPPFHLPSHPRVVLCCAVLCSATTTPRPRRDHVLR